MFSVFILYFQKIKNILLSSTNDDIIILLNMFRQLNLRSKVNDKKKTILWCQKILAICILFRKYQLINIKIVWQEVRCLTKRNYNLAPNSIYQWCLPSLWVLLPMPDLLTGAKKHKVQIRKKGQYVTKMHLGIKNSDNVITHPIPFNIAFW